MIRADWALYPGTVARVATIPPCEGEHDYHRFMGETGDVLTIRCLNCGRRPIDELEHRVFVGEDAANRLGEALG